MSSDPAFLSSVWLQLDIAQCIKQIIGFSTRLALYSCMQRIYFNLDNLQTDAFS